MEKIAVVIVTYNRLEKLKKTLNCYDSQSGELDIVIVVNNNSSDGTIEYLANWEQSDSSYFKRVINLSENLGGSGGFYYGEKEAVENGADWVLVADDDAYPDSKIVERFRSYLANSKDKRIAAVCTKVCDVYGNVVLNHRRTFKLSNKIFFKTYNVPINNYDLEVFDLDLFTYVGTFLNVVALKEYGLCDPDFFIYCDDAEHSLRLLNYGDIICLPDMMYVHDSGADQQIADKTILLSWREYYGLRNHIFSLLKHHFILAACYDMCWQILKCIVKYRLNIQCVKLVLTAFSDAICCRLGKHNLYKPGFNIKK